MKIKRDEGHKAPGIAFKCWFFFPGWDPLVGQVPILSFFLDHTEKNLNQEEWEDRLLQVCTLRDTLFPHLPSLPSSGS